MEWTLLFLRVFWLFHFSLVSSVSPNPLPYTFLLLWTWLFRTASQLPIVLSPKPYSGQLRQAFPRHCSHIPLVQFLHPASTELCIFFFAVLHCESSMSSCPVYCAVVTVSSSLRRIFLHLLYELCTYHFFQLLASSFVLAPPGVLCQLQCRKLLSCASYFHYFHFCFHFIIVINFPTLWFHLLSC